jgi:hypothetical protein
LTQTASNVSWIAAAIDDFPDRGAPFRITTRPIWFVVIAAG